MKLLLSSLSLMSIIAWAGSPVAWTQESPKTLPDSVIVFQYRSDSDSVRTTRYEYRYDHSGNLTNLREDAWDTVGLDWKPVKKFEEEWDEFNNRTRFAGYKWDSPKQRWIGLQKTESTFLSFGKQLLFIQYNWDSLANTWEPQYKTELEYANGYRIRQIDSNWDTGIQSWVYSYKYDYEYDKYGNQIISLTFFWWRPQIMDWVPLDKYSYDYNSSGKRITQSFFEWNQVQENFVIKSRIETTYTIGQMDSVQIKYVFYTGGEQPIPIQKREYTYDEIQRRTSFVLYGWNSGLSYWHPMYKEEYSYAQGGNPNEILDYTFDEFHETWIPGGRLDYQYDESGRITYFAEYQWDETLNDWRGIKKTESGYHLSGRLIMEARYVGSGAAGPDCWNGTVKVEYVVDSLGVLHESRNYLWDIARNLWVISRKSFSYYPNPLHADQPGRNPGFIVYPNPTHGPVTIAGASGPFSYRLYTMEGRLLKSAEQVSESLDLSDLPAGIYYLRLSGEKNNESTWRIIRQ